MASLRAPLVELVDKAGHLYFFGGFQIVIGGTPVAGWFIPVIYGGFHQHRGDYPSYHPFIDGIVPYIIGLV